MLMTLHVKGTNESFRLVFYNPFEGCFEGNIQSFAIVYIPDGDFLNNVASDFV